jgi:hypothetical protein
MKSLEIVSTNLIWLEDNVYAENDLASSFGGAGVRFNMNNNLIDDNNKKIVRLTDVPLQSNLKNMYQKIKMKYKDSKINKKMLF